MAPRIVDLLAALCSITSLPYLSHLIGSRCLNEHPHFSLLLILFFAGLVVLGASHVLKGASNVLGGSCSNHIHGHTSLLADADSVGYRGSTTPEVSRPWATSIPILVLMITIRLKILISTNDRQQCSNQGVESWICLLLLGQDFMLRRRRWPVPRLDEMEDPWRSIFDDLRDWLTGPRAALCLAMMGVIMVSVGTHAAASQVVRSTYICFEPMDSRSGTVFLQYIGLVLDAGIVTMLCRVLGCSTKLYLRLRTLSKVFFLSSLAITIFGSAAQVVAATWRFDSGIAVRYIFDLAMNGFVVAVFAIGLSVWTCETTPVISMTVITFLLGIWCASLNIYRSGDWMHHDPSSSLGPLWITSLGFGLFVYTHDSGSVVTVRRPVLIMLLSVILITSTIFSTMRPHRSLHGRHPISDLIYEARGMHDRWLVKAATSNTLTTAVKIYQERHGGRDPPPGFGDWYKYATGSSVIDEFQQIDSDLEAYRSMSPALLRNRVTLATSYTDVASITIKDGQVTMSNVEGEAQRLSLVEMADMIKNFSMFLPDMVLPINLHPSPRVLPPWADVQLDQEAKLLPRARNLPRRSGNCTWSYTEAFAEQLTSRDHRGKGDDKDWQQTSASDLRQMYINACGPDSLTARTDYDTKTGLFCIPCSSAHSQGQLLHDWEKSMDVCAQPDLHYLHSFFMTSPRLPLIRDLIPLFGSSKAARFQDILLPIPRPDLDGPNDAMLFADRENTLFGSGSIASHAFSDQAIRGSPLTRLLQLINRPDTRDKVIVILPQTVANGKFKSETVSLSEANHDLSFKVGLTDDSRCAGKICNLIKDAYGAMLSTENPLNYRYVLLLDEEDGQAPTVLNVIRSKSLPFISSIFRTWYSDRLTPWLHFVPIDLRYQGLHTTLLYFTGTANKAKMNGINTYLTGHMSDAEWIAQQGQKWATDAIGRKDMEIYLFRLLLEWGRLIDDRRDEIGYRQEDNGKLRGDNWTGLS